MKNLKEKFLDNIPFFVSVPAILWQLLFLCLPILFIFYMAFSTGFFSFTFEYFRGILDWVHLRIIVRSLLVAMLNATLCLLVAYPVAYFLALKVKKMKNFLLFLLTLPAWVNFLIQVYSWFFVLERNGIINKFLLSTGIISDPLHMINNQFAISLVMFHIYLPFMIVPLYNILEKFDPQLIDASLDLGANRIVTFFRITFPLSLSGVYLGFFLVFVMTFGEVVIPMFLGGNKTLFVGTLISEYFFGARNMHTGAAFTLLSSMFMGATLLLLYILLKNKIKTSLSLKG